jgi:hypothetical protein
LTPDHPIRVPRPRRSGRRISSRRVLNLAAIFGGAADFDLELIESRTLDGNTQELTYRPTLHA